MNVSSYFFPIKSVNLDYYFNAGILAPARYFLDRSKDIQSLCPDAILLSTHTLTTDSNCSLEILLEEGELKDLEKLSENLYLLGRPLPISRIKSVIFESEERKLRSVQGVMNGSGFIPDHLCVVDGSPNVLDLTELKITSTTKIKDFSEQINRFNRYMGGVAMLGTQKNEYNEYHLDYFKLLSNINEVIKDEIAVGLGLDEMSMTLPYGKVFFDIEKIGPLYLHITEQKSLKDAEQYILSDSSSGIRINENKNYNLKDLTKVTQQFFVGLFNSYGTYYGLNRKDTLDSFINQLNYGFIHKNLKSKANVIAFYFGMNKGYAGFRNRYTINNNVIDYKFKLESKLDSYVIESLYNYSFFNKYSSTIFIADHLFAFSDPVMNEEFDYYTVLDQAFKIRKKKRISGYFVSLQGISKSSSYCEIINMIRDEIGNMLPDFIPDKDSLINSRIREKFEQPLNRYAESLVDFIDDQLSKKISRDQDLIKHLQTENRHLVEQLKKFEKAEPTKRDKTEDGQILSEIYDQELLVNPQVITKDIKVEVYAGENYKQNSNYSVENEIQILTRKKLTMDSELARLSSDVQISTNQLEENQRDIETLENDLDNYTGDTNDTEYHSLQSTLNSLKERRFHIKENIAGLDDVIGEMTSNLIEVKRLLKSLSVDEDVATSSLIGATEIDYTTKTAENADKKIAEVESENEPIPLELIGLSPQDVDLLNRYRSAFRSDELSSFSVKLLDQVVLVLKIKPSSKNKANAINLINKKLGLK